MEETKYSRFTHTRQSMDECLNREGRLLIEAMEDMGLIVLNGRSRSDRSGDKTSISAVGSGTIDYIWTNDRGLHCLTDFRILRCGISDHLPVAAVTDIPCGRPPGMAETDTLPTVNAKFTAGTRVRLATIQIHCLRCLRRPRKRLREEVRSIN